MPKAALNLIFLCVWSEAYAGMPDGAAGFFYVPLARVGDTLKEG